MKYILITGCSDNSIGSALAHRFSSHPSTHIFATSRNPNTMSSLLPIPNITLLPLDVTSPSSIASALTTISLTTSTLDVLLNYAGHGYTMPYLDADVELCKRMFDVNVWGAMRVTQAFAGMVVEAGGVVVMAGSTAELFGLPWQAAYCGSKAALRIMSEALRIELKPLGVKVLYISTGFVASNWFANVPEFGGLPEGSMYKGVEKRIERQAKGQDEIPWMSAEKYAEKVVGDVFGGREGRAFRGGQASLHAAMRWIPSWVLDWALFRRAGLNEVSK